MKVGSAGWASIVVLSTVFLVVGAVVPSATAEAAPSASARDCPAGFAMARANSTYAGGGTRTGPGQGTSPSARRDELIGTGCVQRDAAGATMTFHWASIGEIYSGTFVYQLRDCTTGTTPRELSRNIGYPTGTPATSGSEEATVAIDPSHMYRMRITGEGSFKRRADSLGGAIGYWSLRPGEGIEPWSAESPCL